MEIPSGYFIMKDTGLNDAEVGLILLVVSLIVLCGCLVCIVKVLNSMFQVMFQVNSGEMVFPCQTFYDNLYNRLVSQQVKLLV